MEERHEFKPGDIIGFSGKGLQSVCINIGTYGIPGWGISHVGIISTRLPAVVGREDKLYHPDAPLLYESTTDDSRPCEITGTRIKGVQAHPVEKRIKTYPGRVWHYPLYRELYQHEERRLWYFLFEKTGIPYDELGAIRSGGIGLSWIESLLHAEDLSAIFCSEILAATLATTGLYPIVNASRWNPNRLIRKLRRARVICKPRRVK